MKIRKATSKDHKEIAMILRKESSKKPYNQIYDIKRALKEVRNLSKKELDQHKDSIYRYITF